MIWNVTFENQLVREVLASTEETLKAGLAALQDCARGYPEWTQLLVENFDSLCQSFSLPPFVRLDEDAERIHRLSAYDRPCSLTEAIQFLRWFIGHECNDDGSPRLVWLKRTPTENASFKSQWEMSAESGVDHPSPLDIRKHTCIVLRCPPWELDISGKFDKIGRGICSPKEWEKIFRYHPSPYESPMQAKLKALIGATP